MHTDELKGSEGKTEKEAGLQALHQSSGDREEILHDLILRLMVKNNQAGKQG
jgi:hypothetical protein